MVDIMNTNWEFKATKWGGKYLKNGFQVWSNSFEWKVKNLTTGTVYANCFATIGAAKRFAERKMK